MTTDKSKLPVKVPMTVYVSDRVKRGMKIAGTLAKMTTSELVELLCTEYLSAVPGIGDLIEKGG